MNLKTWNGKCFRGKWGEEFDSGVIEEMFS